MYAHNEVKNNTFNNILGMLTDFKILKMLFSKGLLVKYSQFKFKWCYIILFL